MIQIVTWYACYPRVLEKQHDLMNVKNLQCCVLWRFFTAPTPSKKIQYLNIPIYVLYKHIDISFCSQHNYSSIYSTNQPWFPFLLRFLFLEQNWCTISMNSWHGSPSITPARSCERYSFGRSSFISGWFTGVKEDTWKNTTIWQRLLSAQCSLESPCFFIDFLMIFFRRPDLVCWLSAHSHAASQWWPARKCLQIMKRSKEK